VAAFVAAAALAAAGAAVVGAAVGPIERGSDAHGHAAAPAAGRDVGGLAVAAEGYRLVPTRSRLAVGRPDRLAFRILGPDGGPVTDVDPEQGGVPLHLIVVGRDLGSFQHLHPTVAADGTWSTPITVSQPGVHRAFVDFTVDGEAHTLGVDLVVPGRFRPRPLPAPAAVSSVAGHQVALATAHVSAGHRAELAYRITEDGRPAAGLEPYLGARGHLVVLREGDLAYLHVHPEDGRLGAGEVAFTASFPSPGRYRLFLQFQREGRVHTVAHTMEVVS
jgi:hypothetical protein